MQRNRPLILGAVILGILAIGLTLMSLRRPQAPIADANAAAQPAPTKQLVAARTIPPRTVITADMVREDTLDTPTEGGITDRNAIVGKLTGAEIINGAPFTSAALVSPIKRTSPANFTVPPGTRAIAVMVEPNSTMGGIVDVGDRVDVVVVHRVKYRNEANLDGETRSGRTIGQNILVLATDAALKQAAAPPPPPPGAPVDPNAPPAPAPTPAPPPPPAPNAPPPKVRIVLAATPAVAERLAAAQAGEIHLTLRDGVSRDAVPVPEAFEYPIRTLGRTVPRPGNAASGGGNRANTANTEERRAELGVRAIEALTNTRRDAPAGPMMPPMPPATMNPNPPSAAANNVEAGAEVTVIRGTEKSKVVVPQR